MKPFFTLAFLLLLIGAACQRQPKAGDDGSVLTLVAQSTRQWTGIAISQSGRLFVNFPNWSSNVPVSVAEIENGVLRSYPNIDWNLRQDTLSFIAVQSLWVDQKDQLWVLDTNNPRFSGVNDKGPILYCFDLNRDTLVSAYTFPPDCYKAQSYYNDLRVDNQTETAYITDSGDGALIVLNLKSRMARRLLDHHPSTESETNQLFCDGIKWKNTVHSDGIALHPDGEYLYYIALTGHTLYRIPTKALRNPAISDEQLAHAIEKVSEIPATDGMLFDPQGHLYLGGLEDNSINRLNNDGTLSKWIADPRIRWADSFARDHNGLIYFTTSQIYLPEEKRIEYEILRFDPLSIARP